MTESILHAFLVLEYSLDSIEGDGFKGTRTTFSIYLSQNLSKMADFGCLRDWRRWHQKPHIVS